MKKKLLRKTFTFDGKRYDVTGHSLEELYERVAKRKLELAEDKNKITKSISYSKWLSEWLEMYKKPSVSLSWYKTLERICSKVIGSEIGHIKLKDLKPIHLQKVLNNKANMSASYLRKIYNVLNESLETARKNNLIINNPAEAVTIPKGKKKVPRRSITPYEREHVLRVCQNHRGGTFVMIMLYCGLRPSEVAALQWNDIDFNKRTIRVNKALKKDGYIGDPKSEAGKRMIPVPDALYDFLIPRKGDPFAMVCTNASGNPLTVNTIRRTWQSFVHDLNISMGCQTFRNQIVPPFRVAEDLTLYCFRHTFCTDLQAAGVPINVARELMGHSDIAVTSSIYTHSSDESFEDAREKMNALSQKRSVGMDVGNIL